MWELETQDPARATEELKKLTPEEVAHLLATLDAQARRHFLDLIARVDLPIVPALTKLGVGKADKAAAALAALIEVGRTDLAIQVTNKGAYDTVQHALQHLATHPDHIVAMFTEAVKNPNYSYIAAKFLSSLCEVDANTALAVRLWGNLTATNPQAANGVYGGLDRQTKNVLRGRP